MDQKKIWKELIDAIESLNRSSELEFFLEKISSMFLDRFVSIWMLMIVKIQHQGVEAIANLVMVQKKSTTYSNLKTKD